MRIVDALAILLKKSRRHADPAGNWILYPRVFVDNVVDYILANPTVDTFALPCIRPPFRETWVEFSLPRRGESPRHRRAIVCKEMDDFLRLPDVPIECRYFAIEIIVASDDCKKIGQLPGSSGFYCNTDGSLRKVVLHPDLNSDSGRRALTCALEILFQTFAFMHCKNVVVDDDRLPTALAKSFKRKHGSLPMIFKTIRVVPLTEFRRGITHKPRGQEGVALHIVRGHFKDYRERGLFGKTKGIFWWDQSLSGTADRYVENQYVVEPSGDINANS